MLPLLASGWMHFATLRMTESINSMQNKHFLSVFADLSQDIAGEIPVDLIEEWVKSDGSPETHEKLLAPFKRTGIIVSSDSAGLSKLSLNKSLIEVMKLVSEPKELIHAFGKAIGGKPIGVWIADNTQMFYPASVPVESVVTQMLALQKEAARCTVKVGLGIHVGTSYEIGGGLYGADADVVEHATEEESKAGEVMVSSEVKKVLGDRFKVEKERADFFVLESPTNVSPVAKGKDLVFPAPFDSRFADALRTLDTSNPEAIVSLEKERLIARTVVLVRVFHAHEPLLLDQLAQGVATNSLMNEVLRKYSANLVSANGSLMIITLESSSEAVDLSIALHAAAKESELTCNIAVVSGDVLLFDMGNGKEQIAGSPVNVASKLAEDTDERNALFLESSVIEHAPQHGLKTPFTVVKSGVTLSGIRVTF